MERELVRSAAPPPPLKDQGDNGPIKNLTREEAIFALDHTNADVVANVGDRIDLAYNPQWGTLWAFRPVDRPVGRFVNLTYESFPKDRDIDTWQAKVARVDSNTSLRGHVIAVRLMPYPILDCGCVINFGGYAVRRCDAHEREVDELLGDKKAYEGLGEPGWTDDPRTEQETNLRQIVQ